MRSNLVLCGMCRALKLRDSDGQAARHATERGRSAGAGTSAQEVSPDWRARERAKTLLLLCQPLLSREVAQVQDINICTVHDTWQRHVQAQGEPIHLQTLTRILKANGLVCKRTRHSLKKNAMP